MPAVQSDRVTDPERQQVTVLPLDVGEPLAVAAAPYRTAAEARAALKSLPRQGHAGRTVVLCLSPALGRADVIDLLSLAAWVAQRVVVTVPSGYRFVPGAWAVEELRDACARTWPRPPQLEVEPDRAVIGAMLSLREGDSLDLFWPAGEGLAGLTALAWRGSQWRGSYEEPEGGDFHHLPAGG